MAAFGSISSQIETELVAGDFFRVILNAFPISFFFLMLSLALGAFLPRRRFALWVATIVLIESFFIQNLRECGGAVGVIPTVCAPLLLRCQDGPVGRV